MDSYLDLYPLDALKRARRLPGGARGHLDLLAPSRKALSATGVLWASCAF